jgi:hypothetical protein
MSQYIGNKPAVPLPSLALNDLTDVSTSGGANNDLLKLTSGTWSPFTPDFATAAQGALADSAVQPGDNANTLGSTGAADGTFLRANGAGAAAWSNLPNVDTLSSGGATVGTILTADGSGGASFQAPAAAGVDLTTNQTVGGVKTFSDRIVLSGQIETPLTALTNCGGGSGGLITFCPDFSGPSIRTIDVPSSLSPYGTITELRFSEASNVAQGRSVTLFIKSENTVSVTFQFGNDPLPWVFVGPKPTGLAANKRAVLTLTALGSNQSDVVAAWAVEG